MRSRKYDRIEKQKAADTAMNSGSAKAGTSPAENNAVLKKTNEGAPKDPAGNGVRAQAPAAAAKTAPEPVKAKAAAAVDPAREKKIREATKRYEKETRKAAKKAEKAARKKAAGVAGSGEAVKAEGLKRWQKILIIVVIIFAVLGVSAYTAYRLYLNSKLDKINKVSVDPKNLSCVDVDGYANIVLLGVDARNMKKKNIRGTNTDCIVIVSMNEETKKVNLISVYRDTYLRINGTITYDKVNSAFATGGAASTMKTLNEAADLNISKYVLFNFKMVSDMVNAVGGIQVNVKKNEIEQLNKYTKETAKHIGQKKYKRVKKAGLQTLEGVQAVSYGRIRKGVGDDFKRTSRMRVVMTKMLGKLRKASFGDLNKLMDTCLSQCETNLSNNDLLALAQRLSKVEINKSVGWPYNVTVGSLNGISYVFPAQLDKNVVKLHKAMFGQNKYKVSQTVTTISDQIKTLTGVTGSGYQSSKLGIVNGKGSSGASSTAGGTAGSGAAGQSSTAQNGQNSTYNGGTSTYGGGTSTYNGGTSTNNGGTTTNNGGTSAYGNGTSTYGSGQTASGYNSNTRTTY